MMDEKKTLYYILSTVSFSRSVSYCARICVSIYKHTHIYIYIYD